MTPVVLAALVPVVLWLALYKPPYVLLILDLILVLVPEQVYVGGVAVDATDITLVGIIIAFTVRGGFRRAIPEGGIPGMGLWLTYGTLLTLSYLLAPGNREYLTDPARVCYQVLRYCWKPIAYYPLAAICLKDRARRRTVLSAFVLAAAACALQGTIQGYRSEWATGPFPTKNGLGSALIMPLFLAFSAFVYATSQRQRRLYGAALLVLLRGLTMSASRGAFAASAAAMLVLAAVLLRSRGWRPRLVWVLGWAGAIAVVAVAMKPGLLDRPNVKYMLTSADTSQDTFQWRLNERWPYFLHKIPEHPLFGFGTDVDFSLGESANTPHNGYLSAAVKYGVPALGILVCFVWRGMRDGLRTFRSSGDAEERILSLTVAAALLGLVIHNFTEATMEIPFIAKGFWMLMAVSATAAAARRKVLVRGGERVSPASARRPAEAASLS